MRVGTGSHFWELPVKFGSLVETFLVGLSYKHGWQQISFILTCSAKRDGFCLSEVTAGAQVLITRPSESQFIAGDLSHGEEWGRGMKFRDRHASFLWHCRVCGIS